jgi:hypothetical protein
MFANRSVLLLVLLGALALAALSFARPTAGAGSEAHYVVQPGDTLWGIAAERYDGDPREAIWRIKQRNGLAVSTLVPGTVLALPGS